MWHCAKLNSSDHWTRYLWAWLIGNILWGDDSSCAYYPPPSAALIFGAFRGCIWHLIGRRTTSRWRFHSKKSPIGFFSAGWFDAKACLTRQIIVEMVPLHQSAHRLLHHPYNRAHPPRTEYITNQAICAQANRAARSSRHRVFSSMQYQPYLGTVVGWIYLCLGR